jgi:hypothetical protein
MNFIYKKTKKESDKFKLKLKSYILIHLVCQSVSVWEGGFMFPRV